MSAASLDKTEVHKSRTSSFSDNYIVYVVA